MQLSRRDLLRLLGQAGAAAAGATLLGGCKGSPTTPEPPPPPSPVRSNVLVRFYNHTQGYLGEKTYTGMSDSLLEVKVSDCPNISTVDPNLIAVREAIKNLWPGNLIEFSKTGKLNKANFPRQDSEYDAFLMNSTNGADFGRFDDAQYYLGLGHSPNATWDREDHNVVPGPDEIPHEAMRQIKESLVFPWVKYMDFAENPPNVRGDFWVGYFDLTGSAFSYGGSEIMASVDPTMTADDITRLRAFIAAIFEHLTLCWTPGTKLFPYEYLTDNVGINAIGKDLLAYSIARDGRFVSQ